MFLIQDNVLGGGFWTGLHNPNQINCDDAGCVNELKWHSDGSNLLTWPDTNHDIKVNDRDACMKYENTKLNDKDCNRDYYYICESKCQSTTTTTTSTTTTTTTTTTTGNHYNELLVNGHVFGYT